MRATASVTVQNKTIIYDAEGISTDNWTASQTTELVNKQPAASAGQIAFNEYGISDAGILSLYFLQTNSSVSENSRIIDDAATYEVYRVDKYSDHWEAIVKPVVS